MIPLDDARIKLAEAIFLELVELLPERRDAALSARCGSDLELRALVERLVHCDATVSRDIFDNLRFRPEIGAPRQVGRYKIVGKIGEGGMGIVYEAEQESPRRAVALKLIRSALPSRETVRRFEFEAEILGQLQHPGIAQIYEAGQGDVWMADGERLHLPFVAMERVRGRPLTQYAAAHGLDVRQRLELLANICDAVSHAHQRGVIHRDLKPGNILVVEEAVEGNDAVEPWEGGNVGTEKRLAGSTFPPSHVPTFPRSAQPKILDFGVARVTGAALSPQTMQTEAGQLLGTLPYMSPEQLVGDPRAVDTRSDIYALGVIAYELLTGQMPLHVVNLPLPRAIRVLAEDEPSRAGSVRPALRGDVEAILAKALEKDPQRRYAAAAELAADLRRHLRHEPVTARPPRALYQLGKFARRNRALVLGAGLALAALLAGVIGTATFAWREKRQAERAQAQTAQAQAVVRFLRDMLASVDPLAGRGRTVTVRQILDDAARRIESGELAAQPEVEAALRATIGETYAHLGLYREARPHLEAALKIMRALPGPPTEEVVQTLNMSSYVVSGLGDYASAERFDREALELARQLFGAAHPRVARTLGDLGVTVGEAGRWDEAEQFHRQALALWRTMPEDRPQDLAQGLSNLGTILHKLGQYEEAETLLREALALRRRHLPADHPDLAYSTNNLGMLLHTRTKLDEAESLLRESLEIRRRALDAAHPDVAISLGNLALLLVRKNRGDEAVPLFRESLELQRTALGPEHPDVAKTLGNLARVLHERGDHAEAEQAARDALSILRHVFGERNPSVAEALHNLAVMRQNRGDATGAESPLREALAIFESAGGREHPSAVHCRDSLGALLILLERFDEAIALLEEALAQRRKIFGDSDAKIGLTLGKLALARLRRGDPAGAIAPAEAAIELLRPFEGLYADLAMAALTVAEARLAENDAESPVAANAMTLLAEARRIFQERFGETSWQAADVERVDGLYLTRAGRFDEAETALLCAFQNLDAGTGTNLRRTQARDRTRHALAQLYHAWNKPDLAARWEETPAADGPNP